MILLLAALAAPLAVLAAGPRAVIVISLDGVGFEQLQAIDPTFLVSNRVSAITPPKLSFTFPAHATLATGTPPEIHGVDGTLLSEAEVARGIKDRNDPRRLHAKPLWTDATDRGYTVHVTGWPLSPGGGKVPSSAESFDDAIAETQNWDGKAPLLSMKYTTGLDTIGHATGSESPQTRAEWAEQKRRFERLTAKLDEARQRGQDIRVVYTSDHGMLTRDCDDCRVVDVVGYLKQAGFTEGKDFVIDHYGVKVTFQNGAVGTEKVEALLGANGLEYRTLGPQVRIKDFTRVRFGAPPEADAESRVADFIYASPKIFRGEHGLDPAHYPAMNGVIWAYPPLPAGKALPADMTEFKSFILGLYEEDTTPDASPCDLPRGRRNSPADILGSATHHAVEELLKI